MPMLIWGSGNVARKNIIQNNEQMNSPLITCNTLSFFKDFCCNFYYLIKFIFFSKHSNVVLTHHIKFN